MVLTTSLLSVMRCLLPVFAVLITATYTSAAQSLKLVGSIPLNTKELLARSQTVPTEFVLANKKTVGKFNALDVYEILKPQLSTLTPDQLRSTIIVAESSTGETTAFSVAEIQPEISKLPAMLLLNSVGSQTGKIISVQDSSINQGRVDLSKLDAVYSDMIRRRVGLQLQSAPKSRPLQPFSIIFPIDARSDRWLNDVKILKIYTVIQQ
jgi:hypothetical protein